MLVPPNLAAQALTSIYEGCQFDIACLARSVLALTQVAIGRFDCDLAGRDFRSGLHELMKHGPVRTSG